MLDYCHPVSDTDYATRDTFAIDIFLTLLYVVLLYCRIILFCWLFRL